MLIKDLSIEDFAAHAQSNGEVIETIRAGLVRYNQTQRPDPHAAPLAVVALDDDQKLCGGVLGRSAWGWLRIDTVWVADEHRGKGIGRQLIEAAERIAKGRHCHGVHLDTFGFQAPRFYEHLGYECFGQLERYPDEANFFFRKSL